MLKVNLIISMLIFSFTINDTNCNSINYLKRWLSGNEGRIISGTKAQPGQFPWQVLMKINENDDEHWGGSIISENFVLTAAHCTKGLKSVYLMFGITNINDPAKISLTSDQIFIHDDYNNEFLNNDVSIIKLPKPLKFSDYIKPIKLLSRSDATDLFVGKNVIISGYGFDNDLILELSNDLLFAEVRIITNQKCLETYDEENVLDSNLCAVGSAEKKESICHGDSGGPLILEKSPGNFIQIGINSFVPNKICAEGEPAGFVRLGSFLDYIQEETGLKLS